tara:strand:- start:46 stop:3738 length:3693 start_codon:yes stop_codon:yes gene_type:complete
MFLTTVLLTTTQSTAAKFACAPDPAMVVGTPNPAVRFTVLSPRVIRIERAKLSSPTTSFDDRCSFAITNRRPPTTKFTHETTPDGVVSITTSELKLVYNSTEHLMTPFSSQCAVKPSTDLDGVRIKGEGGVLKGQTEAQCCAACDAKKECKLWIFSGTNVTRKGDNCWLMSSGNEVKNVDRTVGMTSTPPGPQVAPFTPQSLSITMLSVTTTWRFGDVSRGNLGGTISSWNEVTGDQQSMSDWDKILQPGLLSRDGWSLIVDNAPAPDRSDFIPVGGARARFAPSGKDDWVDGSPWLAYPDGEDANPSSTAAAAAAAPGAYDAYFFGCGRNFKACLGDWTTLSGAVPLPPQQTVGVWWSKYEAFSEDSIQDLVLSEFVKRKLPLDVLQMDVDWHIRHLDPAKGVCEPFNGYDWNQTLFPDPTRYVKHVHEGTWDAGKGPQRPLKLLLNTHSFDGVDPCSSEFAEIAKELGHTDMKKLVAFNMSDRKTMGVIFANVLAFNATSGDQKFTASKPDYWWTDGSISRWNGGKEAGKLVSTGGTLSNAGNLMWNVHLHDGWIRGASPPGHGNRPMVMPRYAGLGQHRYCCGFSGDAPCGLDQLANEVNMTKTAANVGFAHWSHDVGGFKANPTDEAYVRWTQAAALWPIYRSHGKKGTERRYWVYPSYAIMKASLVLRVALGPYVYTSAAAAHASGVGAVHAMYIDYPTEEDAYSSTCDYEFMHGGDLLVRPIVETLNGTVDGRVTVQVWLPPSKYGWANWNVSRVVSASAGGKAAHISVNAGLSDLPLFARIGAAIPMLPIDSLTVMRTDALVWTLVGGDVTTPIVGSGTMYNDDGETTAYEDGASATRALAWKYDGSNALTIDITAATGSYAKMITAPVTYSFDLRGFNNGAVPTSGTLHAQAEGLKLKCAAATTTHALVRPIGTVVCTMEAPISGASAASFVLHWSSPSSEKKKKKKKYLHRKIPGYVPNLELSDEFNSPVPTGVDATKWNTGYAVHGWHGRMPGMFDPHNVVVGGGHLQLWARAAKRNATWPKGYDNYTTSAVHSVAKASAGSYFEIRWQTGSSGISSSWWFHDNVVKDSASTWTEIDIFESTGTGGETPSSMNGTSFDSHVHVFSLPNTTLAELPQRCGCADHGTKAKPLAPCSTGAYGRAHSSLSAGFHVASLNWTSSGVEIKLDGEVVNTIASSCLAVQAIGMDFDRETMPGWMTLPDPATLPDKPFLVDYVRAWRSV